MKLLESIIYGIIQGLCEFLPVSSSGHLAIAHSIMGSGLEDPLAFDVLLHAGTLVAVFVIYFKDVISLIKAFFTLLGKLFKRNFKFSSYDTNERLVIFIIIATLLLIPSALLDEKIIYLMAYPAVIGVFLIINSVILFFSEKIGKKNKGFDELKPKNALAIGVYQFMAVLPGISRSGMTITGGFSQDLDKESAVKFSFIMSIPTVIGASVLKLPGMFSDIPDSKTLSVYLAGAVAAALTGMMAICLVKFISKKSTFRVFSYYCFAAGCGAIIYGILK